MSTTLSRIDFSAPTDDARLFLMQLDCAAWSEPVRLALSSSDETVTLPGGEDATFVTSGLTINLPSQELSGTQDLAFGIAGVTVDVLEKVDAAIDADSPVTATLLLYTQVNRSAPQKTPLTLEVTSVKADDETIQCAARARDIINTAFPRLRYTLANTPGLKYLG